jgi:hypothetical protein
MSPLLVRYEVAPFVAARRACGCAVCHTAKFRDDDFDGSADDRSREALVGWTA